LIEDLVFQISGEGDTFLVKKKALEKRGNYIPR